MRKMKALIQTTNLKQAAARASLMVGMVLLWVEVAQYFLGGGFAPILVGVVFGYGLTDKIVAAASQK